MRDLLERTVEEVLGFWPGAVEALRSFGMSHCLGCAMARFETLAEALASYQVEPERALSVLARVAEGSRWPPNKS